MNPESAKPATHLTEKDIVNPIDPALSADEKADQLCALSERNRPVVDDFITKIDAKYKSTSSSNCKLKERILAKAARPAIHKEKPWFDVEHIRDGLRFRTALKDFSDLPDIIAELKESGMTIVKAETAKMLNPRIWGWRAVMYDVRLPDGQLVEYYLTVKEVMDANDNVHHPLYEEWRNCTAEEIASRASDYEQALDISNEAFDAAWAQYLERTGQTEATIGDVIDETDAITG